MGQTALYQDIVAAAGKKYYEIRQLLRTATKELERLNTINPKDYPGGVDAYEKALNARQAQWSSAFERELALSRKLDQDTKAFFEHCRKKSFIKKHKLDAANAAIKEARDLLGKIGFPDLD